MIGQWETVSRVHEKLARVVLPEGRSFTPYELLATDERVYVLHDRVGITRCHTSVARCTLSRATIGEVRSLVIATVIDLFEREWAQTLAEIAAVRLERNTITRRRR